MRRIPKRHGNMALFQSLEPRVLFSANAPSSLIESINGSFTASISRLGPEGQSFVEVVGKRLPARWRAVEERMPIDIRNGSSAAAVYLGRPVLVGDVECESAPKGPPPKSPLGRSTKELAKLLREGGKILGLVDEP